MATTTAISAAMLDTVSANVLVTTGSMPLMSWETRDCISPVRVRARKPTDMPSRWSYTASCRSPVTSWPTRLVSQVWTTLSAAPMTTMAAISAARSHSSIKSRLPSRREQGRVEHLLDQHRVDDAQPGVQHNEQANDRDRQLVRREQPHDAARQAVAWGGCRAAGAGEGPRWAAINDAPDTWE